MNKYFIFFIKLPLRKKTMAAKVGIFAAILLVCAILLPSLASAFLEHDSRKTDVTINGDNDNSNVVHANDNDFALPSSDDETRKERSLTVMKKWFKKNKKGKKFHGHGFGAFDFHPLIKGGQKVVGALFPGRNVPQTTEQQLPQTTKQHVPQTTEQNVPQTTEQNVPQTTEQNVPQTTKQHVPQTTEQNVPQTTEQNVPQTTEQNVPQTTEQNLPQTTEQQLPKTTKQHVPQTTEQNVPQTTEQNVPQTTEQNVPQTTEQRVPQTTEQNVPQTTEQNVPQTTEKPVQPEILGGLREGFYQTTCPQAEEIIKNGLVRALQNDSTIAAAIPRLFFHDCFVSGCDGSILLDTTPSGAQIEKLAGQNGVTVKGYELIDEIKAELEKNCPGIVSCSDILAYLSRDAFVASGLPHYEVSGGRRDGMESLEANVGDNIPVPDETVDQMIDLFKRKGLNAEDLVVLIGAHSIGVSHCFNFLYRMDDPEKAKMVDPRLGNVMRFTCTNQMSTLAFDARTQYKMDSVYYKQLLMNRGLLESDQVLAQDIRTRGLIQQFNNDEMGWFNKFGKAMNKLGAVEVLTGNQGQIRKQCRAVNL